MKITKQDIQQKKDHLRKLDNEQKHKIAAREAEIQSVDKMYDAKVKDAKVQGELNLYEQFDRNEKELVESVVGKQEKLEEMKTNLEKTRERLTNEEIKLKHNYKGRINNVNNFYAEKYKQLYSEGDAKTKEVNFKVNESIKDIEANTDRTLTELTHKSKLKMDESNGQHQLKLLQASDNQAYEIKRLANQNARDMAKANLDHSKNLHQLKKDNLNDFTNRQSIHKKQMDMQVHHYDEILKGQKKAFEDKYQAMIAQHQTTLEGLKQRLDKEVQSMTEHQSKQKDFHQVRMNDQFYSIDKLQPQVQETPNSYIVNLQVPEHEKDGVTLSVNDRMVKLTHTRRFENRLDLSDGTVHKGGRSEAFTKEFPVSQILDGRNITQKYENGVLSFKINKA